MLSEKQINGLKRGNVSVNTELTKARVAEDYKAATAEQKKSMRELASAPNFNSVVAKSGAISAKYVVAIAQVLGVSPYYYTGESDDKKPFTGEIMQGFYDKHKDDKPSSVKPKAVAKKPTVKKASAAKKPAAKTANATVSKAKAEPKTATKKPAAAKAKVATPKAKPAPAAKKAKKTPVKPKAVKKSSVAIEATKPLASKKPKAERTQAAKATAPSTPLNADTTLFSIRLDHSAKMNKAVAALDEESVMILLKALSRKASASDDSKLLYDTIKRLLLS
jgi:hypothetical protein